MAVVCDEPSWVISGSWKACLGKTGSSSTEACQGNGHSCDLRDLSRPSVYRQLSWLQRALKISCLKNSSIYPSIFTLPTLQILCESYLVAGHSAIGADANHPYGKGAWNKILILDGLGEYWLEARG